MILFQILAITFVALVNHPYAQAARLEEQQKPHVNANIVSEKQGLTQGGKTFLGLNLEIEKGWHVYWKNPGEVGLPPKLTLQPNQNIKVSELLWPIPERFVSKSLVSFGYHSNVLLPFEVETSPNAKVGELTKLEFSVQWLVCKEVCIPERTKLHIELPVLENSQNGFSSDRAFFSNAFSKIPESDPNWTLSYRQDKNELKFLITPSEKVPHFPKIFTAFIENPRIIQYLRLPTVYPHENSKAYEVSFLLKDEVVLPKDLALSLVLTWPKQGSLSAGSVRLETPKLLSSTPETADAASFEEIIRMFISAFLGGVILNLMPCVFPVLSIKIFGMLEERKTKKSQVQLHGLIYTLGVLISFWVLAGSLMILQKAGNQIGWGFQLQSPYFVSSLIVLFFLMGLNLLGVFEIGLGFMGFGGKIAGQGGKLGALMTGVLSVVVASPCTAPFMGVAMGFALSQSIATSMLIFTGLGLGLAFPFLGITFFPSLASRLPRPGGWMNTVKAALAFPLFATVAWLLWVLQIQSGSSVLLSALFALVTLSLGMWIYGKWSVLGSPRSSQRAASIISLLLFIFSIGSLFLNIQKKPVSNDWQPYSEQRLQQLREQQIPVFVDYTAAWCITCQVNEKVALTSDAVKSKFRELGVVTLKADWTNQDADIATSLKNFGRSGVPLYLLYGKSPTKQPEILPQILTPEIVIQALDRL